MRFSLSCQMILSRELKGVDVGQLMADSKEILGKGAPEGKGAVIEGWSVTGDRIDLKITSGRYVRPHDAVFRLRNFLSRKLGRSHHIGVREISASEYVIKFELDNEANAPINIPFAGEVEFKGSECTLILRDLDEEFLRRNYVDRMINLVREKVEEQHYRGKTEHWEKLWQSEAKQHVWDKDPSSEMAKRNWIKHRGRGQWIFGPTPTRIMRVMEDIIEEELLAPLGFDEVIIPKAVTWDVWMKSGHARNLYPEIYYLCPPKSRDKGFWEEVIDLYKITGEVPRKLIKEKIKEPIGGVCYAQCPPFWPYLEGKTLADDGLPLKVFDRSGTSMRYESGGIHGIERVDEFHRIEIIWVGTPEQVREVRQKIVDRYKKIFNEILELEWRMAWVTPWFMAQEGLHGLAGEGRERDVGTIDFEVYLPYRGSRDESEWLEFQNASNNGDKYPQGFNVKVRRGGLWSGCTGIGLERWLVAFLAQKGMDPKKWPPGFRERAGKLPREIGFL